MRRAVVIAVLATFALAACFSIRSLWACGNQKELFLMFATNAVSEDPQVAEPAIRRLRSLGPAGLKALLDAHADAIKKHADQDTFLAMATAVAEKSNAADEPVEKQWQRI